MIAEKQEEPRLIDDETVAEYKNVIAGIEEMALQIPVPPLPDSEKQLAAEMRKADSPVDALQTVLTLNNGQTLETVATETTKADSDLLWLLQVADAINREVPFVNQGQGVSIVKDQVAHYEKTRNLKDSTDTEEQNTYKNGFDCKMPTCVAQVAITGSSPDIDAKVVQKKGSGHVGLLITSAGKKYYMNFNSEPVNPEPKMGEEFNVKEWVTRSYPQVRRFTEEQWIRNSKTFNSYDITKPEELAMLDQNVKEIIEAEDGIIAMQDHEKTKTPARAAKRTMAGDAPTDPAEIAYWTAVDSGLREPDPNLEREFAARKLQKPT